MHTCRVKQNNEEAIENDNNEATKNNEVTGIENEEITDGVETIGVMRQSSRMSSQI